MDRSGSGAAIVCLVFLLNSNEANELVSSLIELDAGIITACLPSFAKMLQHHLPPWETLRSLLKLETFASLRKGAKRDLIPYSKRSQRTSLDDIKQCPANRVHSKSTNPNPDIELESQKAVDEYVGYATTDTSDDDGIYLKQHDFQRG